MRKLIMTTITIVLISFAIPVFFTSKFEEEIATSSNKTEYTNVAKPNIEKNNTVKENMESYNYKEFNKVRVLHTATDTIEELPLDEYLYGVVSAEMPANFEKEALKAQAIVARTYTIYKIKNSIGKHENADICDDSSCCQAWISKENRMSKWDSSKKDEYWEKIVSCVDETKGKIITYNNEPINAFFHSNSGGKTEVPVNVWGGTNYPYLQAVETSGEEGYTQYFSEVTLTKKELIDKMKEYYDDFTIDFEKLDEIQILEHTDAGRVKTIKIGNKNLSGVEARQIFNLKSANFEYKIQDDNIIFSVIGYGHGVGMSQTGADSLAKEGKTCDEIIKHFYTGVEIINL